MAKLLQGEVITVFIVRQ